MVDSLGLHTGISNRRELQIKDWLDYLKQQTAKPSIVEPDTLVSSCQLDSFILGNGAQITKHICDHILKEAQREVIFVTCFWAKSEALDALSATLKGLSEKALGSSGNSKIRVRICLSSVSLLQKIFHTTSELGHLYSPSTWSKNLNIPPPEALRGLDLQIKSVFILPFSVMHPKFVIIDRRICLMPSCNVSWENWFEGCVSFKGPVVGSFILFWQRFWGQGQTSFKIPEDFVLDAKDDGLGSFDLQGHEDSNADSLPLIRDLASASTRAILLPSPHHRNPCFRPFPWQAVPEPPATPLNTYVLHILETAQRTIFMQTPNLTSPPAISALTKALRRGVSITLVTNERLMLVEQLVTAGTTTSRCLRKLIKMHKTMIRSKAKSSSNDLESDTVKIGTLKLAYFKPSDEASTSEPVQSHLKLTIVDDEVVVLGSGNMDRASWYTSQELGLTTTSKAVAKTIQSAVDTALIGRTNVLYEGG